jgi:hypothetical protein
MAVHRVPDLNASASPLGVEGGDSSRDGRDNQPSHHDHQHAPGALVGGLALTAAFELAAAAAGARVVSSNLGHAVLQITRHSTTRLPTPAA